MHEFLNSIDIAVFRFINGSLSNSLFDFVMPFLTDLNKRRVVLVLCLVLLLWMIIRGNLRIRLAAILLILTIAASDQLNSSIIKFWFDRPRPCRILDGVRLLVDCGSGYSFPSSHATNYFASALVLSFFFPRAKLWVFGFASVIAFSRVYVGVHYPSDVIGGAILGLMVGSAILFISTETSKLWNTIFHRSK